VKTHKGNKEREFFLFTDMLSSAKRVTGGNFKLKTNWKLINTSGSTKGGGEGMYSERRVPRGSRWW